MLQDLLQAGDMSFYFLLPKPPRKASSKPKKAAAAAAVATPASSSGQPAAAGQTAGQSVPGTPVLVGNAAAGQALRSSPMLPGASPSLPQAAEMLPGMVQQQPAAAASAGPGAASLQQYGSGPLLGSMAPQAGNPDEVFPGGFQGPALGVQAYSGGGSGVAGSEDLLQSGLGDSLDDEGMMEV